MKPSHFLGAIIVLAALLVPACKSSNEKYLSEADSTAIPESNIGVPQSVAPPAPNDPKNVIRTAQLQIKVKDVKKTVGRFESLAKSVGGFIESSSIESSELATATKPISSDSVLQVMEYNTYGSITLRVPVVYFDSVVNTIQNAALFVNFRRTSAEDISLRYLANKLKSEVSEKSGERIQNATSDKGKKLDDIVEAEKVASSMAASAIDSKISNFELQQKVAFSSVQVNIYQANQVYKEVITNINISDFKPSFGQRFGYALQKGWSGLLSFLIFLFKIWPVLLFGLLIYLLFFNKRILSLRKKD